MNSERTNRVLEKWGVDGDSSVNREDVIKAAEMYAKIQVRNRLLKKIAFGGVAFMVVFMGLMLGSVIIGAKVSQELKVQNGALVAKSSTNATVLETAEMIYSVKLNLLTPLNVIQGLKSLKFTNKKDGSTIQFNIVSFYHIRGRKLTLYGHTHVANVLEDGSIEFYPINNEGGQKRVDETKMIRSTDEDDLAAMSNFDTALLVTRIYNCDGLQNILQIGRYALMNDITCTLSEPLLPLLGFFGTFNGYGHTITLNMNRNGPVALFSKVRNGAVIGNLFIAGNIIGKGNCSAFAVEAYRGSKFLSSAVYANITCGNANNNLGDYTNMGGFAAVLRNPNGNENFRISFKYSVNQANFYSTSTISNKKSYSGGFYGRVGWGEYMQREFNFTYSASNFTRYGNNSRANRFGFKYVQAVPITVAPQRSLERDFEHMIQKKDDPEPPFEPEDCYGYSGEQYYNFCLAWYSYYWFENPHCCYGYVNDCPLVNCDLYSQLCLICPYLRNGENPVRKIVPTVQKLCGFEH